MAVMSKTMFAAIRSESVLCGLALEDFDIYYQTPLTSWVFFNLSITCDLKICLWGKTGGEKLMLF
jgi:hypothetical protein